MTTLFAASTGDYNGDGFSDLFYGSNYTGPGTNLIQFLALSTAAGAASDPAREYVIDTFVAGTSDWAFGISLLAFGDFNANGLTDILVNDRGNTLRIYTMHQDAASRWLSLSWSIPIDGHASVLGTGDFNGDSGSDMIVQTMQDRAFTLFDFAGDENGNVHLALGTGGVHAADPGWIYKGSGDFNGDTRSDMLFENGAGQYAIWELGFIGVGGVIYPSIVGGGTLLNVPDPGWFYAATADFNGDEKSDILFQNSDGQVAFWAMSGTSVVGGGTIGNGASGGLVRGIGDYDHDRKPDILFLDGNGRAQVWTVDGTSFTSTQILTNTLDPSGNLPAGTLRTGLPTQTFATLEFQRDDGLIGAWQMDVAQIAWGGTLGIATAGWHAKASGDFMGTGESDILYVNDDGRVAMLRTDGIHLIGGRTIDAMPAGWHYAGIGDISGDGVADVVFQPDSGQINAWQMNLGLTYLTRGVGDASGWTLTALADFTGDGIDDLYFHRTGTAPADMLWVNINGTFQPMTDAPAKGSGAIRFFGPTASQTFLGTGDFYGDGHADMLLLDNANNLVVTRPQPTAPGGNGWIGSTSEYIGFLPAGWTLAKIIDLDHDQRDDLVVVDGTGTYHVLFMSGANAIQIGAIADPGAGWHLV